MSTDIYNDEGLIVTRKAGPTSEGPDRARWQFTTPLPEGHVTLNRVQVTNLCLALATALGGGGAIVNDPHAAMNRALGARP